MRRYLLVLLCIISLLSCKKDLIHYHSATRLNTGTTNRLNNILFVNDTLGFCVGGSRFEEADILTTHDGGNTWSLYISTEAHKELFGVTLAPSGAVYLIGFEGNLLRSYDGGTTWIREQLRAEAYKSIAFTDASHAIAVGGISFDRGDAMYIDSAAHIDRHDSLGYELNDIVLRSDGRGWRSGYGTIERTSDGGNTWQWQSLRNDNYVALDVHSDLVAYTCGYEGSICSTHNGGDNWETLRNGNDLTHPKYLLQDILFLDNEHGYAVGEKGLMIYTDDAGKHWSELDHFTDVHLHSITKAPNGDLFVCGEGGEIWKIKP